MPELPVPLRNQGWDPRVCAFRCADVVTVFAVLTRRWTVLVDTLYSEAAARELGRLALEAGARHRGGTAPPLLVLNTHADWDHAWGNGVFCGPKASFPAPLLATRACARRLRSAESAAELAARLVEEPERFAGAGLVAPTLACDGILEIDGGDLTLQLLPAPGHTSDQLVVWIPEVRHLLAADAAEHPMPFVEGPGQLGQLVETLERMRDLEPVRVLACHDRLDGDPDLLARNLAYFSRVRQAAGRHSGAIPPDADLEQVLGLPAASFLEEVSEDARDFYRGAHRKALLAAVAEVTGPTISGRPLRGGPPGS